MKKLLFLGVILSLGLTGCTLPWQDKSEIIAPEEAKVQAAAFINGYLVDPANPVNLGNFEEVSGLYQMEVNLPDGQQVKAYMTKDGKYFFTQGIDINEAKNMANQQEQQPQQPIDPIAQVQIETLEEGDGQIVQSGDLVTVDYEGRLEDGTVFDSSYERGEPITFPLGQGQVIPGWEQGLIGMKVGETRKLTIPPSLGYGSQGAGETIPPNATLIFEIELLEVKSE